MNEVVFEVKNAPEGGYLARALGASIFTEADTVTQLYVRVQDAVRCHYYENNIPALIRLRFGA